MRLLPAEALLNNTRRLCISPSSGNRPWMGDVTAFFVFRNTHGQGVKTALNTPPSLLNDPPLPHRKYAPYSLPSSRRQNLKDMNPYLFAVITVRQNLNVMDFHV